ncbi:hypothetical protein [Alteribacillus sp. HJP-4]|uniref:hypothetical protein n=1 Tax=Alteribacillus sp. HJP-4 TaxID=2775394 RepID=UPI0035CCCA9C
MIINKTRGFLYQLGGILEDVNAVQKGKFGQRVASRATGIATWKSFIKIFK